jgi:hypothetical protein
MGLLQRLGSQRHIAELIVFAVVRYALLGKQAAQRLQPLVHARPALLDRHAQALEFIQIPSGPHPEVEAAARNKIDRGRVFRHPPRFMEGQDDDEGAKSDALGTGGRGCQDGEQRRRPGIDREMMLRGPEVVEAQAFGRDGLFDPFPVNLLDRDGPVSRVAELGQYADVHACLSSQKPDVASAHLLRALETGGWRFFLL